MGKNMRFYGGPGALVVLTYCNKILLDKNTSNMIDCKQFSRQRRLVRFRIALREVETARRLRSQFHGLRREELETEGIGRLLDLDEDGARPARRRAAEEGRGGAHGVALRLRAGSEVAAPWGAARVLEHTAGYRSACGDQAAVLGAL